MWEIYILQNKDNSRKPWEDDNMREQGREAWEGMCSFNAVAASPHSTDLPVVLRYPSVTTIFPRIPTFHQP